MINYCNGLRPQCPGLSRLPRLSQWPWDPLMRGYGNVSVAKDVPSQPGRTFLMAKFPSDTWPYPRWPRTLQDSRPFHWSSDLLMHGRSVASVAWDFHSQRQDCKSKHDRNPQRTGVFYKWKGPHVILARSYGKRLIFGHPPGSQAWNFSTQNLWKKLPNYVLGKVKNYQGRSVGKFFEI